MTRRLNYTKRPKKKKASSYEKHETKITIILSLIKARETVSEFDIRHALKLSYTESYQLMTDLQHNYRDFVSWNKIDRIFTHIKDFVIEEEEIKIKPLTDDERKTIDAIKQEIKN